MKELFKKTGLVALAFAFVFAVSATQVKAEAPVITASLEVQDMLKLNLSVNQTLDLAGTADVKIEYFVGNLQTPIANTMESGAPLIKDKTWDGYLAGSTASYSKGSTDGVRNTGASFDALLDEIPSGTQLGTLVKKGYHQNGDMDYVAIVDWTTPATYFAKITVINNEGDHTVETVEFTVVDPTATSVSNEAELRAAIDGGVYTTINLTQNIDIAERLIVARPLTINGVNGSKTITFIGTEKNWVSGQSNYVIQAYNTTVNLNNLKLTDGYAGLLVNGSTVNTNNLDVSGNNVGGIDVSNGGVLNISGALTNSSEMYAKPTVWDDMGENTINGFSGTPISTVVDGQVQYYLVSTNAKTSVSVSTIAELKSALDNVNVGTITLTAPIETIETIIINRSLVVNGGNFTIKALNGISGSVVLVTANNVSIDRLTVDGSGKYVQGIQFYKVTGGVLTSVTSKNNGKSGLMINGSKVTVTDISTSGNTWHGINVDRGTDVDTESNLTVLGSSAHTEAKAIWVDDKTKSDISVTAEKYTVTEVAYTTDDGDFIGKKYVLTPEITEQNKSLSITATTPEVNITVDENVENPTLDFTSLVAGNVATTPVAISVTTETNKGSVKVSIPTGTVITGTGAWTELALPKISTTEITPELGSRQTAKIGLVIEVGSSATNFTFDKPVRLVFEGQTGKSIGFMKAGEAFKEIKTECGLGDTLPLGAEECKTNGIEDLVVLTKHFTTFATYDVTTHSSGGGSSRSSTKTSTDATPTVTTPAVTAPVGQVLGAESYNFSLPMKVGVRGNEVMELQKFLNAGNFGVLGVDGIFGPKTKAAVMAMQRANTLVADGIVGPMTRAALNK